MLSIKICIATYNVYNTLDMEQLSNPDFDDEATNKVRMYMIGMAEILLMHIIDSNRTEVYLS